MRILALSPHTDDVEIGAGATLIKWRSEHQIRLLAFSSGNNETGANENEFEESCGRLGKFAATFDYCLLDFTARNFPRFRQSILDILIVQARDYKPHIVLCPTTFDVHQDHEVVAQEAIRAFRDATIIGYDMPWNYCGSVNLSYFVTLDESHLNHKWHLMECYDSQKHRQPVMSPGFVYSLARVRGAQSRVGEYAEAFEVIRWHS